MFYIPEIPYIYPVFILLSFIIPLFTVFLSNRDIKKDTYFYFSLYLFICSVTGGVLYAITENLIKTEEFKTGLSAYGGAIGLICGIYSSKYIFKNSITDKVKKDIFLSIPLFYSVSKLACALNGCCAGKEYTGLFSVCYSDGISKIPVQFIEVIVFFIIYRLIIVINKSKYKKYAPGAMLVIAGAAKGVLEILRESYTGFSIIQAVSLFFVVSGLINLIYQRKSRPV